MNKEKKIELLHSYIDGELTNDELISFEQLLETDEELANEFDLLLELKNDLLILPTFETNVSFEFMERKKSIFQKYNHLMYGSFAGFALSFLLLFHSNTTQILTSEENSNNKRDQLLIPGSTVKEMYGSDNSSVDSVSSSNNIEVLIPSTDLQFTNSFLNDTLGTDAYGVLKATESSNIQITTDRIDELEQFLSENKLSYKITHHTDEYEKLIEQEQLLLDADQLKLGILDELKKSTKDMDEQVKIEDKRAELVTLIQTRVNQIENLQNQRDQYLVTFIISNEQTIDPSTSSEFKDLFHHFSNSLYSLYRATIYIFFIIPFAILVLAFMFLFKNKI